MAGQVVAVSSGCVGSKIARVCVLSMLLVSQVAGADKLLLDVLALRGGPESEVAQALGEPEQCGESYQGRKCDYGKSIEVTFIDGKADWFQVSPEGEVPFEPTAIRLMGLQPTQPAIRNPFRMHWIDHQGLKVVSVFASGRYVSLIQVQAFTP